jgi:tetratricopeptide (TPR) repeat protein
VTSNSLTFPPSQVAAVSRFSTSPRSDFSLDRISYIFGLCIVAGASFCAYNLYRCYQFIRNPSSHLDNNLKPVKCEMLLYEVEKRLEKNASANVIPLLEECGRLLPFVKSSHRQQKIALNLVKQIAKIDLNYASKLAFQFLDDDSLFRAAKTIQKIDPNVNHATLALLYQTGFRNLTAPTQQKEIPILNKVIKLLSYAEAFRSINKDDLTKQALDLALASASQCKEAATKAQAFLKIAKTYASLGNQKQCKEILEQAQQWFDQITSQVDLTQLHLASAHLFYDCNMHQQMSEEFNKITPSKISEDCQVVEILSYLSLYEKISLLRSVKDWPSIEAFIDGICRNLQKYPQNTNRVKDYLAVAEAYRKYKMEEKAQQASECALTTLETLLKDLEDTDEDFKAGFGLLCSMTYYRGMSDTTNQKLIQLLVQYYEKSSFETVSVLDKKDIGSSILRFCNRNKANEESEKFFTTYQADLMNHEEKDPCDQIIALTSPNDETDTGFSPEQYKRILKTAEGLLSKVPSHSYASMLAHIAEGYLKVDYQKCLELFNRYAHDQAWVHCRIATITSLAMGLLYISPTAFAYLSFGFGIYRSFRPIVG